MPATFLILKIIERGMIKNVCRSLRKLTVFLVRSLMTLEFSRNILKNTQISNFIKIRPEGAELFHSDKETNRRTDRHTWRS